MKLHTPGPWHVEHGTPTGRRLVADLVEGDPRLIHYRIVHDGETDGDGEADARLIAAAPELLAAAKAMVRATDPYGQKEALDYLYAVIDKAEGR